jgi:hypothetical protein
MGRPTSPERGIGIVTTKTLPSRALAPIDHATLDAVARRINALAHETTLNFAYSVGDLIVRELFEGDLALWGKHGTRATSYRQLAARSDLSLSPSALCRAVGIYALCERHGGPASWPKLSASHLQEVLGLPPSQQERFLRVAESEGWSSARLRAEIANERPKETRGRPRGLLKTVRELETFLTETHESLLDAKGFAQLDHTTASDLHQTLSTLQRDLDALEMLLGDVPIQR